MFLGGQSRPAGSLAVLRPLLSQNESLMPCGHQGMPGVCIEWAANKHGSRIGCSTQKGCLQAVLEVRASVDSATAARGDGGADSLAQGATWYFTCTASFPWPLVMQSDGLCSVVAPGSLSAF